MRRSLSFVLLSLLALAAALPAAAGAHQGNPNFRSIIRTVSPQAPGVKFQILSLDDRIELTNTSGKTVIAYGYNKRPQDPYVRILGDGTVQVNMRSPSAYINSDRYGGESAPASADPAAAPQWKTIDKTGRYEWHDHRIHYMVKGTPPQVKDKGVRTKIFDWQIPISVGASKGDIAGQLFWQPKDEGGPPVGAIVGFAVLLLAGGAAVVVTRRRRAAHALTGGDGTVAGSGPAPDATPAAADAPAAGEAAPKPHDGGKGEAW